MLITERYLLTSLSQAVVTAFFEIHQKGKLKSIRRLDPLAQTLHGRIGQIVSEIVPRPDLVGVFGVGKKW